MAFFSILLSLTRERTVEARGPQIKPHNPRHVLVCERDLGILLEDLHKQAFSLQERALSGTHDLHKEWARYEHSWRNRWSEVGRRCRLDELGGDQRYPALALLAQAHAEMDELAHVYTRLIHAFADRQEERLQSVRDKLRSARQELRRGKAGS